MVTVHCGESQTYTIAKRYSDFLAFDSMFRTAFPTFVNQLAPLPSKLTLINKEETRKKTFNAYVECLSRLISGIAAKEFTKVTLMRKLAEFLRLPGIEESKQDDMSLPDQRHSSLVDNEQVTPWSGCYAGYLNIQHHNKPWTPYYCSLQASDAPFEERKPGEEDAYNGDLPMLLYLFANQAESHFKTVICLKGGEIRDHPTEKSTLELRFDYNEHPILIRAIDSDILDWKRELIQKMTASHSVSLSQSYPSCGIIYIHGNCIRSGRADRAETAKACCKRH